MNLLDRLRGALIGVDEALNAVGGGSPRQTVSGTAWRAKVRGKWWGTLLVGLFDGLFGAGHCQKVAEGE